MDLIQGFGLFLLLLCVIGFLALIFAQKVKEADNWIASGTLVLAASTIALAVATFLLFRITVTLATGDALRTGLEQVSARISGCYDKAAYERSIVDDDIADATNAQLKPLPPSHISYADDETYHRLYHDAAADNAERMRACQSTLSDPIECLKSKDLEEISKPFSDKAKLNQFVKTVPQLSDNTIASANIC